MKAVSKDLLNAVLEHPGLRSVRVRCMDEQRRFGRRKVSATFANSDEKFWKADVSNSGQILEDHSIQF